MIEELKATPVNEFKHAVRVWMRLHGFYSVKDEWLSEAEWDERKEDWSAYLTLYVEQDFFALLNFNWVEWEILDKEAEKTYEEWTEFLSGHGYGHNISLGCWVHFAPL